MLIWRWRTPSSWSAPWRATARRRSSTGSPCECGEAQYTPCSDPAAAGKQRCCHVFSAEKVSKVERSAFSMALQGTEASASLGVWWDLCLRTFVCIWNSRFKKHSSISDDFSAWQRTLWRRSRLRYLIFSTCQKRPGEFQVSAVDRRGDWALQCLCYTTLRFSFWTSQLSEWTLWFEREFGIISNHWLSRVGNNKPLLALVYGPICCTKLFECGVFNRDEATDGVDKNV